MSSTEYSPFTTVYKGVFLTKYNSSILVHIQHNFPFYFVARIPIGKLSHTSSHLWFYHIPILFYHWCIFKSTLYFLSKLLCASFDLFNINSFYTSRNINIRKNILTNHQPKNTFSIFHNNSKSTFLTCFSKLGSKYFCVVYQIYVKNISPNVILFCSSAGKFV